MTSAMLLFNGQLTADFSGGFDLLVTAMPFLMYSALLCKLFLVWKRVFRVKHKQREARLAAILLLMTLCTLTFMAANAYALEAYGNTLLSMRVFQMFVLSNYVAYWLILDLITKDAREDDARLG